MNLHRHVPASNSAADGSVNTGSHLSPLRHVFPWRRGARGQTLEDTQQEFLHGKYEDVIMAAKKQVAEGSSSEWRMLLIKSLISVGRYGEAYTNAQNGLTDYPIRLRMFLLAREAALYQNDLRGANRVCCPTRRISSSNGAGAIPAAKIWWRWVRRCCCSASSRDWCWRIVFARPNKWTRRRAKRFSPAANWRWTNMISSWRPMRFAPGLKKFPDDPDMNAGLAKAFESGDREEMMKAHRGRAEGQSAAHPQLLLLVGSLD